MSVTKRFMEFHDEQAAIRAALEMLINEGRITNSASVGIARKVIHDGNLEGLSEKQKEVFSRFIAPEMKIDCEQCAAAIPLACYPEVIANSQYEGQVLCEGCLHFKEQMRKS